MRGALVESTVVWLIDAHPLLRSGLRAQLDGKGFEVAAEASTIHLSLIETRLKATKPKAIPQLDIAKLIKTVLAERARDRRSQKSGARPKKSQAAGKAR